MEHDLENLGRLRRRLDLTAVALTSARDALVRALVDYEKARDEFFAECRDVEGQARLRTVDAEACVESVRALDSELRLGKGEPP